MAIIRWQPRRETHVTEWNPFRDFDRFGEEMSRLLDLTFGVRIHDAFDGASWNPPIDVIDEGESFRVRADLPGMKRDQIQVTLDGNTLTIHGERKSEAKEGKESSFREERYYGAFSRSFVMPMSVDASKVDASYRNGVLEVVVGKSEAAKPKQIRIES